MKKDYSGKKWINNTKTIEKIKSIFDDAKEVKLIETIKKALECIKAMDNYPEEYKKYRNIVRQILRTEKEIDRVEKELNSPYKLNSRYDNSNNDYIDGLKIGLKNLQKQKEEMENEYNFCYIGKEESERLKRVFKRIIAVAVALGISLGVLMASLDKSLDEEGNLPKEPGYSDGDIDLGNDDTTISTENEKDTFDDLGITQEEFENYLKESNSIHAKIYNFLNLYNIPNRTEEQEQEFRNLAEEINIKCKESNLKGKLLNALSYSIKDSLGINGVTDVRTEYRESGTRYFVITDTNGQEHKVSILPNEALAVAADSNKKSPDNIQLALENTKRQTIYDVTQNPNYETDKYRQAWQETELNVNSTNTIIVLYENSETHLLEAILMQKDNEAPMID